MPKPKGKKTSSLLAINTAKNGVGKKSKKVVKVNIALTPAVAARTISARPSRNANIALNTPPRYFREPEYGLWDAGWGASWMNVQIGPGQGGFGMYGSTPLVDTPSNMRWLKDNEPAYGWVAGHLLNDNLGGPGIASNLTPLTTAGNKNHLNGCETIIKNSIDRAHSFARANKSDDYWYGVEYSVLVSDDAWPNVPVFVAVRLTVNAKVIRKHKATGTIEDAPVAGTPKSIYFAPIVDLPIDNPGYV